MSKGRELQIEHRITRLEEAVVDLRDNHLTHLAEDIKEIRSKMNWATVMAFTILVGILVDIFKNYLMK